MPDNLPCPVQATRRPYRYAQPLPCPAASVGCCLPMMQSPRLAMGACLLAIFTTIFASHLPTPLYAVWQQAWSFSSTALTAVFSVYVLGVVLTLLTMGSLSDQIGRRQMVIPGLLFILVGSTLFMFASNINHLGVARLITGIGTGLVTGAATAAVVEMMTDGNWARGATFAALAFTLGASLGPTTSSLASALDQPCPCLALSGSHRSGAAVPDTAAERRPGRRGLVSATRFPAAQMAADTDQGAASAAGCVRLRRLGHLPGLVHRQPLFLARSEHGAELAVSVIWPWPGCLLPAGSWWRASPSLPPSASRSPG